MSDFEDVLQDFSAFADEESEAAVDADGSFILQRNGQELTGTLNRHPDGYLLVEADGAVIPYRRFLTHNLARLDVLAQRFIERRSPVPGFVNAEASLQRAADDLTKGDGLTLLDEECRKLPPFSSRVLFLTADAGHGKTALLREHQHSQAVKFAKGDSHYLFWHLDLQGRQLLRLSEALMGDLADLRLSGLWMPAVIRLMKSGALVVGIDGFDELAAEQGGSDALGALASLVSQLGGQGAVVAASRRTFFDTDDYLRRGGLVRRGVPDPCQFDQIELNPWTESNVLTYFQQASFDGAKVKDPSSMYESILSTLGGDTSHPLITRPFLITQIAKASVLYNATPEEFLKAPNDQYSGVATVVAAFVKREVAEKWKVRETGEPYLTEIQHLELLADVAEEMHRSQKDRLHIEIIETIAAMLLEQWSIDSNLRQQVIEMVRMHVLLVTPPGDDHSHRSFDHPEFRDYFIAYSLREKITSVMEGGRPEALVRFLSIAQLSDATARYVASMIDRSEGRVKAFLVAMESVLEDEWKPTYLQQNLGTLIPFIIDGVDFSQNALFAGRVIYSSLAFERSRFNHVSLKHGTFVNASLRQVHWRDVTLDEIALGELQIDSESQFLNVKLLNCKIEGVRLLRDGEEEIREYAPARIQSVLESVGFTLADDQLPFEGLSESPASDSESVRILRKLLRMFNRTTIVSDDHLQKRFGSDFQYLDSELIPYLIDHGVLGVRKWKGAGIHRAWALSTRLESILAAEGSTSPHGQIWSELQSRR